MCCRSRRPLVTLTCMSFDWRNLRTLNGSQHSSFEELCCQLAFYEAVPPGAVFTRKGAPDAGVECFWKLPDRTERAWQAKFFAEVGKNQWAQLDKSVSTALTKHPQLSVYTVCLPLDRRDPRVEERKGLMDEWNAHVDKWQGWARAKGMFVEFDYWGEHELWERLSREEHRGRHLFWFSRELFSQRWFANSVDEGIANAGPRYTPEVHVGLPIADLFEGLGRTPVFFVRVNEAYGKLKKAYSKIRFDVEDASIREPLAELKAYAHTLLPLLEGVEHSGVERVEFEVITRSAFQLNEKAWEINQQLEEAGRAAKQSVEATTDLPLASASQPDVGYSRHLMSELARRAADLGKLTDDVTCRLANVPALLLVGDAGTGKSHLFCDAAEHRVEAGLPTVLLLGENFSDEEPWSQITTLLGMNCGRDEFLGALNAAGQAANAKALLMIDALNEGEGKKLWRKHLAGMLTTLARYPWISLAVSVRSSYENTVILEGLVPDRMVRAEHHGFADHEYEATATFFDFYGIVAPSVPLLTPE